MIFRTNSKTTNSSNDDNLKSPSRNTQIFVVGIRSLLNLTSSTNSSTTKATSNSMNTLDDTTAASRSMSEDVHTMKTSGFMMELEEETAPPTICNSKGKKGGVRFRSRGSIEEVRRISRVSNYNLDEVISYWGDSDDHILRKQELRKAAKEFQCHRRQSDNNFTSLGIADKVGEGRELKKKNRNISRNAVLDEQDLQDHEGVYDDELISDVYTSTTYGAKKAARDCAEQLQKQVEQFDE